MTDTAGEQQRFFWQGSLHGVEGTLANLSTAVTQVKIDIERKRSLSPTGEGLPAEKAANLEGFREGLRWALHLLDTHVSNEILFAASTEAHEAGERAGTMRRVAVEEV